MKTISLKKVSAVAVASLGFGLLSVVPANAAITSVTDMVVAELAAGATNLNTFVETGTGSAADRAFAIYTGGAATLATADIQVVTTATAVETDAQKTWIAPGNIAKADAAVTAFATFPATAAGASATAAMAAVTGSLTLTGAPAGITTTTLAGSEAGTVYTIFGLPTAGTVGTPSTASARAVITVFTRVLEATLGDGTVTKSAVNGIAGPANTVSLRVIDSSSTAGVYNRRNLVTVSGAGAKITTATGAPFTIPVDGLSATLTGNAAASNFNTFVVATPTVGTVTVSAFIETSEGSGIFSATAASTVTVTVNAAAIAGGISATTSTGVMNAAATWSSTTEATVTASRTASATPVAAIKVTLGQVSGAITGTTAVTAAITGAGTLLLNASDTDPSAATPITGRSVSSTVTTLGEVFTVGVAPDGTSGVGTVTITAGAYSVTKTVTFYGAVAKYTATTILNATANGAVTTDAVVVCATDVANVAVPNATIWAYSGTPTVATVVSSNVTGAAAVLEDLNGATNDTDPKTIAPTTYVAAKGIGCAGFSVTGLAQILGSSTVITFGNAATLATSTVTTTSTVNVGSVAATTVTLSANKATYAPGERMTITLTFKDSASRLVAAGAGTGTLDAALSSSVALSGAALFNATSNTSKLGVVTADVFAPLTAGPVTLTGTTGADATFLVTAMQGKALSLVVTVTDGNAAANAAANAALTTRIDSLNAKIVALTALIAKIMKSLKIK